MNSAWMDLSDPERSGWLRLIDYQHHIAGHWQDEADQVTCHAHQRPFVQFFFYFAGFNSIYFLWGKLDGLDEQAGDWKSFTNWLKKFETLDESKAKLILEQIDAGIKYFSQERPPITRMDERSWRNPERGDDRDGRQYRNQLRDTSRAPWERIAAMGKILYLVRSNLVHGSKSSEDTGIDRQVIIKSLEPLTILLRESIDLSRQLARSM